MSETSSAKQNLTINALLMDEKDNVVTCVSDIQQGENIVYRHADTICTLIAKENIPYCHKAALTDIPQGEDIIKYGESLGKTTVSVNRGAWVADHNLVSVPRDYASEMLKL